MPDPWPACRATAAAEPARGRAPSGTAARSRLTLAASVAALLGLGLYVSSGDRPQPTAETPPQPGSPAMLPDAKADGTTTLPPMGTMP